MKYKFTTPLQVGDIKNTITVDEMQLHSISLTFDPQGPVLSFVLEHLPTGWKHNAVYTDSTAVQFWAQTMQKEFDAISRAAFTKMAADGNIPPGAIS